MKVKKERKPKTVDTAKKEKRIGMIFNPAVRICQATLTALFAYVIVIVTALDIIPTIGGVLGDAVSITEMTGWPILIASWIFPYLFVMTMICFGEYKLIRFITKKISAWANKLIVDYKQKQLDAIAKKASDNN